MSLFKKPRKQIQRRVFSEQDDDEDEMTTEDAAEKESKKREKSKPKPKQPLLSFETEEEGEIFQVKKSSHSKKLMRMYEKERKKKEAQPEKQQPKPVRETPKEIVTDDLVVVVNSIHKPPTPPPPQIILSGRAALCAGKDDLSSDEDDLPTHKFSRPENFKKVLESGAIPDAAMIHAARKSRQRAREMGGDFIPVEEEEPEDKGRLLREDDNEGSDEERIDMGANPVIRDQERRREQFYEAQDSDQDVDEWEDQQIRKGVTGTCIFLSVFIIMC